MGDITPSQISVNSVFPISFGKIYTFGEKTPLKLIKRLRPDVIVKGDDYQFSKISGSNLYNVILFKKKNKLSSTKIISNLK